MLRELLYTLTWTPAKLLVRAILCYLGRGRVRVHDAENVPHRGGVLICPNHVSDADPAAIAVTCPRRTPYFVAKRELFDIRYLGFWLRLWRVLPIQRDSADRAALRRVEELLKAGEAVILFPEGGGNDEATLQPLHAGALLIALRAKVPVVPVAMRNTAAIWTYSDVLPHRVGSPHPISVTFGEPLDFSDIWGKPGATETATRRLTETLAAMLGQPVPVGKPRNRSAEETLTQT
ncbi:MAG: 1-acyl-sn-glycerol-3-phosphate acyltransferase [Akkermansiaceae bacterium]|nr:1-acyl-sn-glycerol-3-phosphate acyltransferase [Armatimonadota bacterium]